MSPSPRKRLSRPVMDSIDAAGAAGLEAGAAGAAGLGWKRQVAARSAGFGAGFALGLGAALAGLRSVAALSGGFTAGAVGFFGSIGVSTPRLSTAGASRPR